MTLNPIRFLLLANDSAVFPRADSWTRDGTVGTMSGTNESKLWKTILHRIYLPN